jgi:hypothetical protein
VDPQLFHVPHDYEGLSADWHRLTQIFSSDGGRITKQKNFSPADDVGFFDALSFPAYPLLVNSKTHNR